MSINEGCPPLFSDLDGTAVEKLNWKNPLHAPRNITKMGLAMIAGYPEFMCGARDSGLRIGGAVSIRKPFRRSATEGSIRRHGLDGFFWRENTILASNESKKAAFIIAAALDETVAAFIDDQPQKFGKALIENAAGYNEIMEEFDINGTGHVVLGVVNHERAFARIATLGQFAQDQSGLDVGRSGDALSVMGDNFRLDVVQLEPYSRQAGEVFAEQVLTAASLNS